MRIIKQMYIRPKVSCVNMDVLGMLCGSTTVTSISKETNNSAGADTGYGPSIEHDGGGEDNDL